MENQTARIANATPVQLIEITYDLIVDYIQQAKDALQQNKEDIFKARVEKAQQLLMNLAESLDMSYEISYEIMPLYLYVNKLLIHSTIQKKNEPLEQSEKILNNLLVAWREVAKQKSNDQNPVLENTQQIYAGLTYGKGTLNETVLDPNNKKRGIQA